MSVIPGHHPGLTWPRNEGRTSLNTLLPLLCSLFILLGCQGQPSAEELEAANYGDMIAQGRAEELLREFFQTRLKDPESARYRFTQAPKPSWWRDPVIAGSGLHFGQEAALWVNAKNGYGGYTGEKRFRAYFFNDVLRCVMERIGDYWIPWSMKRGGRGPSPGTARRRRSPG